MIRPPENEQETRRFYQELCLVVNKFDISRTVSVSDYGAKGDGATDDSPSIQSAIDAVSLLGGSITGGVVFFPPGTYALGSPLVLPRSGLSPTKVVHLVGENVRSVRLLGLSTFPTNRALIEWEAVASRCWHQRISNLNLILPSVSGVMAIYSLPADQSTANLMRAETWQGEISNLVMEGSNQYHTRFIYLRGNIKFSTLEIIYGDPSRGTYAQDVITIEVDSTYADGDGSGINYSSLRNMDSMIRSGGWSQLFKGRLHRVTWDTGFAEAARQNPGLEFINSSVVTLTNVANEGGGGQPQIKFTNCSAFDIRNVGTGLPVDQGDGVGNGIEFINCSDMNWDGHFRELGNPLFSASAVKQLTIDADCKRLRFKNFQIIGLPENEMTILAPIRSGVYGEFVDVSALGEGGLASGYAGFHTIGSLRNGMPMLATGIYDFGISGGSMGDHFIGNLPDNATITRCWYEVLTTPTSAGAATISAGVHTDDSVGIVGATAYDNAIFAVGYHDAIQQGAAADFTTKTTARRKVFIQILTADLTAGKIQFWWEYVVSD